jgi:acyl-CoA thioesterase I
LALAVAASLTTVSAAAGTNPRCEAPASLTRLHAPLPKLATALAGRKPVRIVALGSSSTQGIGASSPKSCYPMRLQAELQRRFPDSKITVDNLGIGGQLATDMLPRIRKDVLPRKPTLVIWQTGVNDAMRHVDLETFRKTVLRGIDLLQKQGIDVVLLDMQYFPRAEKVRDFARYLVAMRQIAEARKLPIVRRYAIMKHLVTSAQFTFKQLLAKDLFHPNDVTYGCLGRLMAQALQEEVAVGKERVRYPAEPAKQAGAVQPVPVH